MAKIGLSAQWLRDNTPEKPRRRAKQVVVKAKKVRYLGAAISNPQDDGDKAASDAHASVKIWKKHRTAYGTDAHCAKVGWLKENVAVDMDECLFFPGSNPGFVQQCRFNFRDMAAARAMCILAHGLPSDIKMLALHSCGNGKLSCVNPKHLRWGTAKDNAQDALAHRNKQTAAKRIAAISPTA